MIVVLIVTSSHCYLAFDAIDDNLGWLALLNLFFYDQLGNISDLTKANIIKVMKITRSPRTENISSIPTLPLILLGEYFFLI